MVVKTEKATYVLGPGCLRLLDSVMHGVGAIIGAGREALQGLRDKTGETVAIHVRAQTRPHPRGAPADPTADPVHPASRLECAATSWHGRPHADRVRGARIRQTD